MEWPTHTIAFPRYRQSEERREWCGAFGHLYRVIGNCTNGVPDNTGYGWSAVDDAARVELLIAEVRCAYCVRSDNKKHGVNTGTIAEMRDAVDRFLNSEEWKAYVFSK